MSQETGMSSEAARALVSCRSKHRKGLPSRRFQQNQSPSQVRSQMLLFMSSEFQNIQNPGSHLRGQRECRRWSVQSGEYHRDVVSLLVSEEYQRPLIFHQVEWDLWHRSNCPLQMLLLPLVLPTLSVNQNDELY